MTFGGEGQAWRRCVAALAAGIAMLAATAHAQEVPAAAAVVAWADQYVAKRLADGAAPGVVVAVVLGGQIVHLKGYGFADDARTKPMDPAQTLMRLGGLSQVAVAATGVAAADAGILRLTQDLHPLWAGANLTIDGPTTVTMQDLLSHRAGFGDRILGQVAAEEADWEPLRDYLARAMPPQILPDGTTAFPSAHGLALAGLSLEVAANESLDRLAQRLVFTPLAMDSTTFAPQLSAASRARLATGHHWGLESLEPVSYDFARTYPAVGLVANATDAARLMRAILVGGTGANDARAWGPESNRDLITRKSTNDPSMAGRSFAFVETPLGGRTVWKIDGVARGFAASMALAPDIGLGLFIAANAGMYRGPESLSPAGQMVQEMSTDLIAALWPAVPPAVVPVRNIAPDDRADYAGTFRDAAIDPDTPLKVLRLRSSVRVENQSDIRILVDGESFQKVGLDLFQDGPRFVRFVRDADGSVTHLLRANEVFARSSLFEKDPMQRAFMSFTVLMFGVGALVSLAGLVRRARGARANIIGLLSAGGGLALIAWFAWQIANLSLGAAYVHGIPGLPYPLWAWLPALLLAPLAFLYALFGIGIPNFNRYALIGIALGWAAFYPVLSTWNLLA
ncbi:MAG: class A beta-lactamase-related serine hydrolase [Alphaproteobacteria bacterium]|nr:class A beta-lactamase-related serine hydrolase [Alphaproteobacteria bacterium]